VLSRTNLKIRRGGFPVRGQTVSGRKQVGQLLVEEGGGVEELSSLFSFCFLHERESKMKKEVRNKK
jgi:hypothetical protein